MKKNKFEEIEANINKNVVHSIYENEYDMVKHMELQNAWLATEEGKQDVGAEQAETMIASNQRKVGVVKQKLAFLKKYADRKI